MLSADHLRHFQAAQRALLAFNVPEDPSVWPEPAFAPLRRLFGTDHVYYVAPALPESVPLACSGLEKSDSTVLVVCSPGAGEVHERAIVDQFAGFEDGFTCFRDPYATFLHRTVRALGAGAYHDGPIRDAKASGASEIYQEVNGPAGIERQMALSVPLPLGEAMLIIGFACDRAPDFGGSLHVALELLLPAFEAGLYLRRRAVVAASRAAAGLEATGQAVAVFAPDGAERYRTEALVRLLATEPEPDRLATAVRRFAADLLKGTGPVRRDVTLAGGAYAIRGGLDAAVLGAPGALVVIKRMSVLPSPTALRERFGLTPREAEVAGLLAQGFADKEVAETLFISLSTARRHAERVLKKVGIGSRAGLAYACLQTCGGTV